MPPWAPHSELDTLTERHISVLMSSWSSPVSVPCIPPLVAYCLQIIVPSRKEANDINVGYWYPNICKITNKIIFMIKTSCHSLWFHVKWYLPLLCNRSFIEIRIKSRNSIKSFHLLSVAVEVVATKFFSATHWHCEGNKRENVRCWLVVVSQKPWQSPPRLTISWVCVSPLILIIRTLEGKEQGRLTNLRKKISLDIRYHPARDPYVW